MDLEKTIRISILVLTLLKRKDELTVLDIVMTVLPYVDKEITEPEAKAIVDLIEVLLK